MTHDRPPLVLMDTELRGCSCPVCWADLVVKTIARLVVLFALLAAFLLYGFTVTL